jgi:hypothetical protein
MRLTMKRVLHQQHKEKKMKDEEIRTGLGIPFKDAVKNVGAIAFRIANEGTKQLIVNPMFRGDYSAYSPSRYFGRGSSSSQPALPPRQNDKKPLSGPVVGSRAPQTAIEDTSYMKGMGRGTAGQWTNTGPRRIDRNGKTLLTNLNFANLNEEMNLDTLAPRSGIDRTQFNGSFSGGNGGATNPPAIDPGAALRAVQDRYEDSAVDRRMAGKTYTIGSPIRSQEDRMENIVATARERGEQAQRMRYENQQMEKEKNELERMKIQAEIQNAAITGPAQAALNTSHAGYYNKLSENMQTKSEAASERLLVEKQKKLGDMLMEIDANLSDDEETKELKRQRAYAWFQGQELYEEAPGVDAVPRNFIMNALGYPDQDRVPPRYAMRPFGAALPKP